MRLIREDRFYLVVFLLLIMIMAVRTPLDSDMWWHLGAGEATWQAKEVYSVDSFSHTRAGSDWINHSWLSQLVMFGIFSWFGYAGMAIWVGICAVISLGLLYPQLEGHPLSKGAVLLFSAVVASVVWSPRPQIHSLVLFSLISLLLYSFRNHKNWRILLVFPPIFAVWGNLHGGYVLGLILIGGVIAGELLNKAVINHNSMDWKSIGMLIGTGVISFSFVLLNPFGFKMWEIPFNTVAVQTLQQLINEWASPDFHSLFQQPMMWMMLGAYSLMALAGRKVDGVEIVTLAGFSWLALTARRNFGPFALAAAPIFSKYLQAFITAWLEKAAQKFAWVGNGISRLSQSERQLKPWLNNLVNLTLIGLLLFAVGWKVDFAVNQKFDQALLGMYPVEAVDWMRENQTAGNLFNDYNWGGYLIWHLRDQPVFVDGRTDMFGDAVLNDYLSIIRANPGWEDLIQSYGIGAILIKSDSILARELVNAGWEAVIDTETAVVFLNQ